MSIGGTSPGSLFGAEAFSYFMDVFNLGIPNSGFRIPLNPESGIRNPTNYPITILN